MIKFDYKKGFWYDYVKVYADKPPVKIKAEPKFLPNAFIRLWDKLILKPYIKWRHRDFIKKLKEKSRDTIPDSSKL